MANNVLPRNKCLDNIEARVKKQARGSFGFAFSLYQSFTALDPDSNLFFSPFCIIHLLGSLNVQTKGDTNSQIEQVLKVKNFTHNKFDFSFLNEAMRLMARSKHWDPPWSQPYKMLVSTRLYIPIKYNPEREFIWYNYKLDIRWDLPFFSKIDFNKETQELFFKEINACVETLNSRKIPDCDVPENFQLLLISAVYFKGDWAKQFDENDTYEGDFFRANTSRAVTSLMHMTAKLPFAKYPKLKCRATRLDYSGDQLSMYIILPDAVDGLRYLEAKLTSRKLKKMTSTKLWSFKSVMLELVLPKFELEMVMPISEILKECGIVDLFSPEKCNLSRLGLDSERSEKRMFVSDMQHRARLDFHEENSNHYITQEQMDQCAATTENVLKATETFTANHPFMFFIYDKFSKLIIFMGRFTDPESAKRLSLGNSD